MNIVTIKQLYEKWRSIAVNSGFKCEAILTDDANSYREITIREIGNPNVIYSIDFKNGTYTKNGSDEKLKVGNYKETFPGSYQLCELFDTFGSGIIKVTKGDEFDVVDARNDLRKSLNIHGSSTIGAISLNEDVFIIYLEDFKDAIKKNNARKYYKMDQFYLGRNNIVDHTFFVRYGNEYSYLYNEEQIKYIRLFMSNYLKFLCSELTKKCGSKYVLDFFGFDRPYKEVKYDP